MPFKRLNGAVLNGYMASVKIRRTELDISYGIVPGYCVVIQIPFVDMETARYFVKQCFKEE